MLDKLFGYAIIFLLGCGIFYILYFILYQGAEKRIAEAKPRDRYFYLSHIYVFLFKVIFYGGFIVFVYGPAIAVLYFIYEFIVGLIS